MDLWYCSLQATSDKDMKAKVQNVKAVMSNFQFSFSRFLGKMMLKETDNLNKKLCKIQQFQMLRENIKLML